MGDRIVEINGYAVYTDRDLSFAMALADPKAVRMTVERDGQRVELSEFALHTQVLEDGSEAPALECCAGPAQTPSPWPAWWWRALRGS